MENNRVLFIIARCSVEPLGIMYLSAMAKKYGFVTKCYRYVNDESLYRLIKEYNPRFVCFSMTTGQHIELLKIGNAIKKNKDLKCYIMIGGAHPTFFPEVQNEKCVDIVIRGEAEYRFVKALQTYEDGTKLDFTNFADTPEQLDDLPFPDRELVYEYSDFYKNPIKNVLTARGCPYVCSYCYNSSKLMSRNSKKVRYRSVDNVIAEILEIKQMYAKYMKLIFFADDEFTTDVHRLRRFLHPYKKFIATPFHCQVRIDMMTEEKVSILKDMGCRSITFAIESGNEYIRRTLLNRHMSNKKIMDGAKLLKKKKIKFRAENMIGLPNESLKNMFETIDFNRKVKPDYAWVSIFQPYPGTLIEKYCKDHKLFNSSFTNFDYLFSEDTVLNYDEKTKLKIKNIQRLFSLAVSFTVVRWMLPLLINLNLTKQYSKLRNYWKSYCYNNKVFK